ncbi:hypothetical protein HDU98_001206 [Podochytrium sp. JEL0797]|nr:hypothetical protein HDU98_001206 [Podochytrium sp. JEL0797]
MQLHARDLYRESLEAYKNAYSSMAPTDPFACLAITQICVITENYLSDPKDEQFLQLDSQVCVEFSEMCVPELTTVRACLALPDSILGYAKLNLANWKHERIAIADQMGIPMPEEIPGTTSHTAPVHPVQFSPTSSTEPFHFPAEPVMASQKRSKQAIAARKWRAAKSAQVAQLDNRIQQLQDNKTSLEKCEAVLESAAATFGPRELELKQRIALLEGQLREVQMPLAKA